MVTKIKNLGGFVLFYINPKFDKKRFFNFIALFFGEIGFTWTLIEFYTWLFAKDNEALKEFFREYIVFFLIIFLAISYFKYRTGNKIEKQIPDTDICIVVEYCDIFKMNGAIIIPSMDTFDTNISNGLVNPDSLHGKLIEKYYKNNVNQLDNEIDIFFSTNKIKELEIDNSLKGKKKRYAIGTTAILRPADKYFYLSATTFMKHTGNVEPKAEYIADFLSYIWLFIADYGTLKDEINIPVIGTFIKRLPAQYTHHHILFEIIKSYLAMIKDRTVCKKLRICLYRGNYKHYDFKVIEQYLDHAVCYY